MNTSTQFKVMIEKLVRQWNMVGGTALGFGPERLALSPDELIDDVSSLVLSASNPSGYSRLWDKGRLDLSLEAQVVNKDWCHLFSAKVVAAARKRLRESNFTFER